MEKVFVAQRVVTKLVSTEDTVDRALAETAELMGVLLQARRDVNADIKFADAAQAKLMQAMQALSEARTAMVDVHGELAEAKLRLGIRTSLGGGECGTTTFAKHDDVVTMREVG